MVTNKQIIMSYNSFKNNVYEHLAKYNGWKTGYFKGKPYDHIVDIDGKTKEEIVKTIIEEDGVCPKEFRKPHMYAHHLNSSQVICYEFFKPLIENKDNMSKVVNKMEIPFQISNNFEAVFEKEFENGDGTNFDFFLSDNKHNIYIEVKYTEQGFASCKNDENHRKKFKDIYRNRIKDSFCIEKNEIDFTQMRKYYQLFRNVLQIQKETDFVVFLFPKENSIAKKEFEDFRDTYLSEKGKNNVKGVFWEDLTDFMSSTFKEKFFFYI